VLEATGEPKQLAEELLDHMEHHTVAMAQPEAAQDCIVLRTGSQVRLENSQVATKFLQ
jgi:hypothetical protein